MLLSIIIPAYNAEPYLTQLLARLAPQMNDDVEVLLIDDGSKEPVKTSHKFVKVFRQKNGGAAAARNKGIEEAKGDYIAFIDADDLVSEDYIEKLLEKLAEKPDYVYLSWETLPGPWHFRVKLKSVEDEFPPFNLCVWNRVYKRSLIGKTRFNTKKLIAEDAEFIRDVQNGPNKAFLPDIVYLYRADTPNSLTKRFSEGKLDTRRAVYHFKHVTADMTYLIEEIREKDKEAEVILMTEQNDIPELADHAMVITPRAMKGTEFYGEPTPYFQQINLPVKTQVVIWTAKTYEIGGIETFIYAFCRALCKYYDIIVLYEKMAASQIERLIPFVEVRKIDRSVQIECDTLIVNRIIDKMPINVSYKQSVQMVHGVKHASYTVPQDKDVIVAVSQIVKDSFGEETKDAVMIHNMTYTEKPVKEPLLLVSATRLDTIDKGEKRMFKLADLMDRAGVKYIWLCFTNKEKPPEAPEHMIYIKPTLDIMPYIKKADYLVQLSDHEAFCYSMVEALELGTPVIVTPLSVLDELGMADGINGYIVPFNVPQTFDVNKFCKIPEFTYTFDNEASIKQWRKLLGNTKPTKRYKPADVVRIRCTAEYYDMQLQRKVSRGEEYLVPQERASRIVGAGYGIRL
ncbi:MAG: glycosyltransferase [Oscillospiraceae bacterium]|nr:glycosyltransferase [Oscillospiraceae bacterium]